MAAVKRHPARLTPAFLEKVGRALHGPAWRAALAEDLGVYERTVRRWAKGESEIPRGIRFDLIGLLEKRQPAIAELIAQLGDMAD